MATANDDYPVAQEVPEQYINVITVDDRTFRVETHAGQTLQEFRVAVTQATGIQPQHQRLISSGRLLFGDAQAINLPHNAYVHLAPLSTTTSTTSPSTTATEDADYDDGGYLSNLRLSAHMSQLNGFAWLILVYFSLVSWRLMMVIAFEQDDIKNRPNNETKQEYLERTLLPNFLTSLFGVCVGLYGVWTASHRHLPNAAGKIRWYALLISLLAFFSFLASLEYMDSNSFAAVFVVQMMFWYCVLQARITEHAYVSVHGVREQQQQQQPVEAAAATPVIVIVPVQPPPPADQRRDAAAIV